MVFYAQVITSATWKYLSCDLRVVRLISQNARHKPETMVGISRVIWATSPEVGRWMSYHDDELDKMFFITRSRGGRSNSDNGLCNYRVLSSRRCGRTRWVLPPASSRWRQRTDKRWARRRLSTETNWYSRRSSVTSVSDTKPRTRLQRPAAVASTTWINASYYSQYTPPTPTQLDFVVGKFVQTRRDCRQLVANSIHTADATQLDSWVASASAVCVGFYYWQPIGSRTRAFDWCQNQRPWTLEGS